MFMCWFPEANLIIRERLETICDGMGVGVVVRWCRGVGGVRVGWGWGGEVGEVGVAWVERVRGVGVGWGSGVGGGVGGVGVVCVRYLVSCGGLVEGRASCMCCLVVYRCKSSSLTNPWLPKLLSSYLLDLKAC